MLTLFATVRYVLVDNRKEHSITMDRLTIIPMPYKTTAVQLRPRVSTQAPKHFEKIIEKRTPLGWLKWGRTSRKHEAKGWLAETFIKNGELIEGEDALWKRVLSDYRCQLAYLEVTCMKEVLAGKYSDPTRLQRGARQKFRWEICLSQKGKPSSCPKKRTFSGLFVICI